MARNLTIALSAWLLVPPIILFWNELPDRLSSGGVADAAACLLWGAVCCGFLTVATGRLKLVGSDRRARWNGALTLLAAGTVLHGIVGYSLLRCPLLPLGLWIAYTVVSLVPLVLGSSRLALQILDVLTPARAGIVVVVFLGAGGLLEIFLNALRGPVVYGHPSVTSEDKSYWYFEPGATLVHRGLDHRVNSWGFRGAEPTVGSEELRVLLLGDSVPFGAGFEESSVFPWKAEFLLAGGTMPVTMMNASLPGYGTQQMATYYERHLKDLPHDVVVLCFYINDINRTRRYMRNGLLYSEYWPEELQDLYYHSHIGNAVLRLLKMRDSRFVGYRPSSYEDQWPAALNTVEKIESLARARGVRLAVLDIPEFSWEGRLPSEDDYQHIDRTRELQVWCRDRSIPFRSVLPALVGVDIAEVRMGPADIHLNEAGHELVAPVLVELLREAR